MVEISKLVFVLIFHLSELIHLRNLHVAHLAGFFFHSVLFHDFLDSVNELIFLFSLVFLDDVPHDRKELDYLLVWNKVNARLGKHSPVVILLSLKNVNGLHQVFRVQLAASPIIDSFGTDIAAYD